MTAGTIDEERFLVLNSIVLKKMGTVAAVAQAVGLPFGRVEAVVTELEASEDVALIDDQLLPLESAGEKLEGYDEELYAGLRGDTNFERWLARFEPVNRRFLQAVTAWQQMEVGGQSMANDHSDPEYDARVISKIDAAVTAVGKLIAEAAERVPRLKRYRERFEAALEKVEQGQIRFVSDPLVDSIHNVWFEFHEDILRILGKKRVE
jgi:hypothetical protein